MEFQFKKKFDFERNPQWKLPEISQFYSQVSDTHEPLQLIKRILNHVKQKLDDFKIEGKFFENFCFDFF